MRKAITFIMLLLLLSICSIGQWTSIVGSPTRLVTNANLLDAVNNGVFYWNGTAIPNDNRVVVKSNIPSYVAINTSNTTYAAKSSGQAISVQDLTASWANSGTLYAASTSHNVYTGWSTSSSACSTGTGGVSTTAYWGGTISAGTSLYLGVSWVNTTDYFYLGGYYIKFSSTYNDGGANNYAVIGTRTSCSASIYSTYVSGTYPVIGTGSVSGTITITNNSGANIYIYGIYNSAGATSGTASATCYWSTAETIGGTVTHGGQAFVTTNYATLATGSTTGGYNISKNSDGVGTGANVRWAYSTTVGGALTVL